MAPAAVPTSVTTVHLKHPGLCVSLYVNEAKEAEVCDQDFLMNSALSDKPVVRIGEYDDGNGFVGIFTGQMWKVSIFSNPIGDRGVKSMFQIDPISAEEAIDAPDLSGCQDPNLKLRLYNGSFADPAVSCQHLVGRGFTTGNYYIKPPGVSVPQFTFCDLDSIGGGWTQIAFAKSNQQVFWGTLQSGFPDKPGFSINANGFVFDEVLVSHEGLTGAIKYQQFRLEKTSFPRDNITKAFRLTSGKYMVLESLDQGQHRAHFCFNSDSETCDRQQRSAAFGAVGGLWPVCDKLQANFGLSGQATEIISKLNDEFVLTLDGAAQGSTDGVSLRTQERVGLSQELPRQGTISVNIRLDSATKANPGSVQTIFSWHNTPAGDRASSLGIKNGNQIGLSAELGGKYVQIDWREGNWQNVALTWSANENRHSIFVNGNLVSSGPFKAVRSQPNIWIGTAEEGNHISWIPAEGNRRCDAKTSLSLSTVKGSCSKGEIISTSVKESQEACQSACEATDGCKFSAYCSSPPTQWIPLLGLSGQRCQTFEVANQAPSMSACKSACDEDSDCQTAVFDQNKKLCLMCNDVSPMVVPTPTPLPGRAPVDLGVLKAVKVPVTWEGIGFDTLSHGFSSQDVGSTGDVPGTHKRVEFEGTFDNGQAVLYYNMTVRGGKRRWGSKGAWLINGKKVVTDKNWKCVDASNKNLGNWRDPLYDDSFWPDAVVVESGREPTEKFDPLSFGADWIWGSQVNEIDKEDRSVYCRRVIGVRATPTPTPFVSEVHRKITPAQQGRAQQLPFYANKRCAESLIISASNPGTTVEACTASCLAKDDCQFFTMLPTDNTCELCKGDNKLRDYKGATMFAVDHTKAACTGANSNMCTLFSRCPDVDQTASGFALTGIEKSGTGLAACQRKCQDNPKCFNFVVWEDDGACELCKSATSLLDTQTTKTLMMRKDLDKRTPLNGNIKNFRIWTRELGSKEISQAGREALCDDTDCKYTNANLPDAQLDVCGAWAQGNTNWPRFGGKMFFRCSDCTFPEPATIPVDHPDEEKVEEQVAEDDGSIRLVPSSAVSPLLGRLEVKHDDKWGSVCSKKRLTEQIATVACRELGRKSGVPVEKSCKDLEACGAATTPVFKELGKQGCTGNEEVLLGCPGISDEWTGGNCDTVNHLDDVIVQCDKLLDGDLRIVPSEQSVPEYGRLEVFHKGEWGTLCFEGFSSLAATVACTQMGYLSGEVSDSCTSVNEEGDSMCGTPSQRIWLDDLTCTGAEQSLLECPRLPWSENDKSSHSRDVMIRCSRTAQAANPELLQISEGADGKTIDMGTGVVVAENIRTRSANKHSTSSDSGRISVDRPVPVPAADKPKHQEFVVKCSNIRKQKANAICSPAKVDPIIYDGCIRDYCLTGSEELALAAVREVELRSSQREMMEEEMALVDEEEKKQEADEAELYQNTQPGSDVRKKIQEVDDILQSILGEQ
eukprot:c52302_g1_i1.p1 GENE.c52302_g1_i1~~c52302_g1_i1.p1  ORF type:complete len:1508 (+),score=288.54 c52302_g1_i1:142-4524(+)